MSGGYFVKSPEERILEELRQMRRDIEEIHSATLRIPVREADPPVESPISMWMLLDGRLRARRPDGEIVEYAQVGHNHDGRYQPIQVPVDATPGGGVSTIPPAPGAYTPTTRVYEAGADWTECYWRGGSQIYANADGRLYYSMYTSSTGELKSMIHFPDLVPNLAPGPAGSRIAEVWIRISNLHTTANSGGVLRMGLHNAAGKPGSFQEVAWPPLEVPVGKPSMDQWYQLPNWVGEQMRDGLVSGVTFNANSTSRSLYGYAANNVALKIVHVN